MRMYLLYEKQGHLDHFSLKSQESMCFHSLFS